MYRLFVFFFFLLGIPMTLYLFAPAKKQVLSEKTVQIAPTKANTPTPTKPDTTAIEKAITSVLDQRDGQYGIFYKDLQTGAVYEKDSDTKFYSASLYKLWVMGELFRQVDKGTLKKEEILHKSVPELNTEFHLASDEADLVDGDITFSVDDALENMITVSSNYAALLLSDRLQTANIADFLKTNGFSDSSFGSPPITTPHDIGMLFDKLYNHQLVAPIYTKEMIAILSRQQINDRLPKYLPESLQIAHKTGELEGYKHDAGIIFTPNGDYILVVMSKSDNEYYAAETIAMLSKEVYQARNLQ
jgi:beta-lactamase class A